MKLEVEVISKESIKPSCSIPGHLCHYQLSFLDQIQPPVYSPLVLFYPKDSSSKSNKVDRSNRLKQSLSEVLVSFYPLAGRVKENLYVDCNDVGIPYVEARVKCQLSDVVDNPIPGELNKLVPFELDDIQELALGVQLNIFECGGIGIGLCLSHKLGDALSLFTFVKIWAATARGEKDIPCPVFVSSTLFPPKNISGFKATTGITKDNIVTKRFVFGASMIDSIKAKYANSPGLQNQRPPSRVEALSAFIWSRFVAATKLESGPDRFYTVQHPVNLRTRIDPPLPEYSFGNLVSIAMTIPLLNTEEECYGLVKQVRESISKIDKDYVRKLQEGDELLDFIKERAKQSIRREMVSFSFTSLCRFPTYEADFGWGKPVWVVTPMSTFKNLVSFLDAKSGDGIEAHVSLKVEDMAKLEADKEFLAFVTPTGWCSRL